MRLGTWSSLTRLGQAVDVFGVAPVPDHHIQTTLPPAGRQPRHGEADDGPSMMGNGPSRSSQAARRFKLECSRCHACAVAVP